MYDFVNVVGIDRGISFNSFCQSSPLGIYIIYSIDIHSLTIYYNVVSFYYHNCLPGREIESSWNNQCLSRIIQEPKFENCIWLSCQNFLFECFGIDRKIMVFCSSVVLFDWFNGLLYSF